MNQNPSLFTYTELDAWVQKIMPSADAAQVHGVLCGYRCAKIAESHQWWNDVFPALQMDTQDLASLNQLYDAITDQLNDVALGFTLLLPEDDIDLNVRAEALGLWCQGFLTGLKKGGIVLEKTSNAEIKEAFDDMLEISKISFGDIAPNEEDEEAYVELVEYVRLNVLMLFSELRHQAKGAEKNDGGSLH